MAFTFLMQCSVFSYTHASAGVDNGNAGAGILSGSHKSNHVHCNLTASMWCFSATLSFDVFYVGTIAQSSSEADPGMTSKIFDICPLKATGW